MNRSISFTLILSNKNNWYQPLVSYLAIRLSSEIQNSSSYYRIRTGIQGLAFICNKSTNPRIKQFLKKWKRLKLKRNVLKTESIISRVECHFVSALNVMYKLPCWVLPDDVVWSSVLQEEQSKVLAHRWSRQLHCLLRGRGGRHTSGAEPLGPVCRGRLTIPGLLQFQEVDGWNIRRVNNEPCRRRCCVAISAVRL